MIKKVAKITFQSLFTPLLLAVFPMLSFYQKNIAELSLLFLRKPLVYSFAVIVVGSFCLVLLTKDKHKTALISSLLVFIFFSYGHLSRSLNSTVFIPLPNGLVLGPDKILLPLVFFLTAFLIYKTIKSANDFSKAVSFLNVILLVLVCYLGISITYTEHQKASSEQEKIAQTETIKTTASAPDIYYIILDGYARQDVLRDIYDYDNSAFIKSLQEMGFYVASQARSNYIHTYISLPSTLNMRYLDDLPEQYGTKPASEQAAKQLVVSNEVARKLKNYGYTTINFASTWQGTDESYQADTTIKDDAYFKVLGKSISIDETSITFLQTTLLSPLIKEVWGDALRARTLATLQKLPTIPYQEGRKFITAHIMAPHPPYVFTAEGNPVSNAEFAMADEGIDKRPKYLGQLTFISKQIIPVLNKIIENSAEKPIIILQSDHGPASIFGKRENWLKNFSPEGVKERSSILYAVYFPGQNYKQLYDTITPVNTFRIVFNQYFNENLELLPDKTYYTSYEAMYGFEDVTDIK